MTPRYWPGRRVHLIHCFVVSRSGSPPSCKALEMFAKIHFSWVEPWWDSRHGRRLRLPLFNKLAPPLQQALVSARTDGGLSSASRKAGRSHYQFCSLTASYYWMMRNYFPFECTCSSPALMCLTDKLLVSDAFFCFSSQAPLVLRSLCLCVCGLEGHGVFL